MKMLAICLIILTIVWLIKMDSPIKEIWKNKKLLCGLAKNDFKVKYVGSYIGVFWSFVQPVMTVMIYWFVFQIGFKSTPVKDFPFLLWLVTGLVPWFFFSECVASSANCMLEYSYLVKKIVFKIDILPVVKIVSALFTHIYFSLFTILLFLVFGKHPDVYIIQILYYTLCLTVFILGISYISSALQVFFKDTLQIISILLQIIFWYTAIVWDYKIMPASVQYVLKANPLYYIVDGFRDTFINKIWFWEKNNQTLYFWCTMMLILFIGNVVFKRLKPHFADVL